VWTVERLRSSLCSYISKIATSTQACHPIFPWQSQLSTHSVFHNVTSCYGLEIVNRRSYCKSHSSYSRYCSVSNFLNHWMSKGIQQQGDFDSCSSHARKTFVPVTSDSSTCKTVSPSTVPSTIMPDKDSGVYSCRMLPQEFPVVLGVG
jgi:hypothetical protein